MKEVVVISDNQYFLIGFNAIHPTDKEISLLNPHLIDIEGVSFHQVETIFVFISDIEMHRKICNKLQSYRCIVRFFFSFSRELLGYDRVFWDSRMRIKMCQFKLSQIYRSRFIATNSIPFKNNCPQLLMMSKGMKVYMEWLKRFNFDAKKNHFNHRKLLRSVGYYSVNIHNLFHSEYLAPSINVINKIRETTDGYEC